MRNELIRMNQKVRDIMSGKDSTSADVIKDIKDGKEKFQSITGKSTVLRTLEKMGDDTSDVLGIPTVNNQGGKKNDE